MENNGRKRILLIGNPNVGKSVIFSRLTGTDVIVSNYPGTTVGFTEGVVTINGCEYAIIDVPGIYNMDTYTATDTVAVNMIKTGDIFINVMDATNLERNIFLTLELRELGVPVVAALNLWDETKHRGIEIDAAKLASELGFHAIPTCGHTGEGIKELIEAAVTALPPKNVVLSREDKWKEVGRIVAESQKLTHHHHTLLERLEDLSTAPATGLPIALGVIY